MNVPLDYKSDVESLLLGIARRFAKNNLDLQDELVQAGRIALWKCKEPREPGRLSWFGYVKEVILRTFRNEMRRLAKIRSRQVCFVVEKHDIGDDGQSDPAEPAIKSIVSNLMLAKLPPISRRVVEMRLGLSGSPPMTLKSIAQALGMGSTTVNKEFRRAIEYLRALADEA